MKKIDVLSTKVANDKEANNGDCFIIDIGSELILFDCGCEDYAKWVIDYMDKRGFSKIKVILSHNDKDHVEGIKYLVQRRKVESLTTVLMLKYVDELLDIIDDGRLTNRENFKEKILKLFDNIKELGDMGVVLVDALDYPEIVQGVKIVGPSKEYILQAAAKGLDSRESDKIDGETITNATSIHAEINLGYAKVLLTGDSTFESVDEEEIEEYDVIQLPHHGKPEIAEQIFEKNSMKFNVTYIISDNTGRWNGGSEDLDITGQRVFNTRTDGNVLIDQMTLRKNISSNRSYID